jgi:N-sulfoglucosamine sulfohydrolase
MNILLITADDMDASTPASFGGPVGVTPTIDALASGGMVFSRAHVVAAVCQPSRSAIMSGLVPHRNGAEGFGSIRDGVPVFSDLLDRAGYRLGILGKVDHLQPVERFGWDVCKRIAELGMGRDPQRYGAAAAEFFADAADRRQPWFLMANAHDPHRPFHASEQEKEKFSADQLATIPVPSRVFAAGEYDVPDFLPDLPDIRTEYAEYLSSARRCDDVVASILTALEESGEASNTVVFFLSDNGMAFPYAKANCYLQSTRTPFIVRWPGVTVPGSVDSESFVSMLDLFPTICDAAQIEERPNLDGTSLLPLLLRQGAGSASVVTVFHETSAKQRFEMRCIQNANFGYIWNEWSAGATEYAAENMEGLSWQAMRAAEGDDPAVRERVDFYLHRMPEELYDLEDDPSSLHNLAGEVSSAPVVAEFRRQLAAWMKDMDDPLRQRYLDTVLEHD